MAKKKKETINLEKVVDEGASFTINEMSDKEADLSKKIPMWIQTYVAKNYGEDQAEATYETLRRDPLIVTSLISQAKTEHENNLITEVRKNPNTLVKAIDQNYTIGLALQFFGDTGYKTLKETIENNGDVKSAFSNAFEGNLWKSMIAITTPEAAKSAANGYVQRTTQREIVKNLCDKEGKFDTSKASTYLVGNIEKQEKDAQNISYKELGLAYAQTAMSQKE
ncbi:hypothetical protein KAT36_02990 [Candidatus Pacearchaeota archaeon]|nr:hypothetical protein [Candidatus Pacearchaeota archaeon]